MFVWTPLLAWAGIEPWLFSQHRKVQWIATRLQWKKHTKHVMFPLSLRIWHNYKAESYRPSRGWTFCSCNQIKTLLVVSRVRLCTLHSNRNSLQTVTRVTCLVCACVCVCTKANLLRRRCSVSFGVEAPCVLSFAETPNEIDLPRSKIASDSVVVLPSFCRTVKEDCCEHTAAVSGIVIVRQHSPSWCDFHWTNRCWIETQWVPDLCHIALCVYTVSRVVM